MTRQIDYSRMRTIEDVKRARIMLNREIASAENNLREDYDQLSHIFSLEYWIDLAGRNLSKLSTTISSIYSGYQFISSFIRKHKESPKASDKSPAPGKKKLFRKHPVPAKSKPLPETTLP